MEAALMPATQHGQPYRLGTGKWGLRYYDENGMRRRKSPFPSKSAALRHYRDVIEPQLRGEPAPLPELTLAELVELYLDRHAANVRAGTIDTLRDRLARALAAFGDVPLHELERMAGDIAAWQARLPERSRHDYVRALRQVLDAGVRWGHMARNPARDAGRNPAPPARPVRVYSFAELGAIALELPAAYATLPAFAAATGLRPEEWAALERRDVDRRAGVLTVARTVTGGKRKSTPLAIVELAKTSASHRQVPLSPRALEVLDTLAPRIDTPLLWPADGGGPLRLDNWRRRVWTPAVECAAVALPARIYDLRCTFASNAIAAGIDVFELARVMGTSIKMIERSYGTLLTGAAAGIAERLAAFEAAQERAMTDVQKADS
jgi:integrase